MALLESHCDEPIKGSDKACREETDLLDLVYLTVSQTGLTAAASLVKSYQSLFHRTGAWPGSSAFARGPSLRGEDPLDAEL